MEHTIEEERLAHARLGPLATVGPSLEAAFVLGFFPDKDFAGVEEVALGGAEAAADHGEQAEADGFEDDVSIVCGSDVYRGELAGMYAGEGEATDEGRGG